MIEHPLAPFRVRDEQGLSYFEVPANTILYRGDLNKSARLDTEPALGFQGSVAVFDWFGFSPVDVAQYGPVHEYLVTQPFRIIEINDDRTMAYLYDLADKEGRRQVKAALKRQFGYNTKSRTVGIRESNEGGDLVVVNFLMNVVFPREFVGYGIDAMPTSHGGRFHPEICIRDPTTYTRWLGALAGQALPVASPPRIQGKRKHTRKTPGSTPKTPTTASATRRRMQWSRSSSSKPTAFLNFYSNGSTRKERARELDGEEEDYDPFAALVTERTSPFRKKGRS